MTEEAMVRMAEEAGFANAALIDTAEIPLEPGFRICCEENLCGKYGVNYACPPACGTVEEMRVRILAHRRALVMQTIWEIDDPMDNAKIKPAKREHNRMERALIDRLQEYWPGGRMAGASGCDVCERCAMAEKKPCRFPELQFSCLSAYCVFVRELAERCGMEYDCGPGLVTFFGLYLFD